MGDGPVANLPAGLDAYAGYVDDSGDGVTFPGVLARFPQARHLSISVHGNPAECADVENGAMTSWKGYDCGYCAVSNVNTLVALYGRPRRLWTAHYDSPLGAHICGPHCWPGLVTTADATQWVDHNGVWDESLCSPTFFDPPAGPVVTPGDDMQLLVTCQGQPDLLICGGRAVPIASQADLQSMPGFGTDIKAWPVSQQQYADFARLQ